MKKNRKHQMSATMRKALSIYADQKATYQKMVKTGIGQGKKVTTAARDASHTYKQLYGATPTARWRRALRHARYKD